MKCIQIMLAMLWPMATFTAIGLLLYWLSGYEFERCIELGVTIGISLIVGFMPGMMCVAALDFVPNSKDTE